MRAAVSVVGPFATSPRLGVKSVKGWQMFLGEVMVLGWGWTAQLPGACGVAPCIRQAAELSQPWLGHPWDREYARAALSALRGARAIPVSWVGRHACSGLGGHVLEWAARGKASSDSGLGPSLGAQAWPCTVWREESAFSPSLGYLPSSPGCSQNLAINNKQKKKKTLLFFRV